MIDIYSWATPNCHGVHIMLEECGLDYRAHASDIGAGEQFAKACLEISANNKSPAIGDAEQFPKAFLQISTNNNIPTLVDSNGPDGKPMSLFESGAILIYLAGKT